MRYGCVGLVGRYGWLGTVGTCAVRWISNGRTVDIRRTSTVTHFCARFSFAPHLFCAFPTAFPHSCTSRE